MNLVDVVNQKYSHDERVKSFAKFRPGDTVAVHYRITEGGKSRIQVFQGTVIAKKHNEKLDGHFRVRKISSGMGVERVFPYHSPNVEKVELISKGKTKRAKYYYLRKRSGKSARVAVDYSRKD